MPRGPIRCAQLIAPFGTGALTVVRDGTSLIAGGLDFWYVRESGDSKSVDPSEYQIQEWRLQELLGVDHFRLPPDYRTARGVPGTSKTPNCWLTVPFLRFPRWHFCSRCNLLTEHPLALRGRIYCEECKLKDLKIPLAQVPFAAMCDHGHLQDFPWREWVHKTESPTCDKPLRLVATGGTTLAAQVVKCECGMNRPLARITEASPDGTTHLSTHLADENTPFLCRGLRPWLGTDERSPCDRHMRGTLRSASNIYFADVRSAIFLPRGDNSVPGELVEALGNPPLSTAIRVLTGTGIAVQPAQLRGLYRQHLEIYTDNHIAYALLMIADGRKAPREGAPADGDDARTAFRRAEYATLQGGNDEQELMSRNADLAGYKEDIRRFFHRIVLVHKLRETRALAGFTRVFPENDQPISEQMSLLWRRRPPSRESWLPAYVVHGEGIFLELDEPSLREWETIPGVQERVTHLARNYQVAQQRRALRQRPIIGRFVLLHTLAHLLINRLTFECGYSTAALRERLYVSDHRTSPMAALLIYTAAGDAEGTMGGLVRMAKPGYLEPVVRRAIESARWCSADPVCMEMGDSGGQGPDSCNLAACHNCARPRD